MACKALIIFHSNNLLHPTHLSIESTSTKFVNGSQVRKTSELPLTKHPVPNFIATIVRSVVVGELRILRTGLSVWMNTSVATR